MHSLPMFCQKSLLWKCLSFRDAYGLITYLLLAIYYHEEHNERVSISRVRELRIKISNKLMEMLSEDSDDDKEVSGAIRQATGHPL
jgi:hypothetical protein